MKKMLSLFVALALLIAMPSVMAQETGVSPIFECWTEDDGVYTAHFGYENYDMSTVNIPLGENNKLTGVNASPMTEFLYPAPNNPVGREGRSGFYNDVGVAPMNIVWDGNGTIVWTLNGHTASASTNPQQQCTFVPGEEEVPEFGVLAGLAVLAGAGLFVYKRRT